MPKKSTINKMTAEQELKDLREQLKEGNIPRVYRTVPRQPGIVYGIYGTSSISYANQLEKLLAAVAQERDEMQQTFDLQHTRMAKATKLWQQETGKHAVWPDLGQLLDWLMKKIK